jgi:hypothetical protein
MAPSLLLALAVAPVLSACEEEPAPPPRYPFTFTATSDDEPLEGVTVTVNDAPIGTTDAEGRLRRDLTGPEGASVAVDAQCPEGYRSPEQAQIHTLRRVVSLDPAAQAQGIQVSFDCPPEHREAVVIVRTHDQGGLPVFVDGREVARTDESGIAHIHMPELAPQTSFQVRIATAAINERLRPSEPTQSFTVPDRDEVFVFDQQFEEEPPPRRRRRRRRRRPEPAVRLPIRIGGGR